MTSQPDGSEHASKEPRDKASRNRRRSKRIPSGAHITLRWRTSEALRFAPGTVMDYSESGLRIELREPIQPRSYVMLEAPGQSRAGWAGWIRYCVRKGIKYT